MNATAATQAAFAGWLLHGDDAFAAHVAGDLATERMRIYADAYRLRLCEVLGNDFPGVRDALGDSAFAALASRYLRAHPSQSPSLRHFGARFADWLLLQDGLRTGLHELARFEWLQGEAFDAADATALDIAALAALPAQDWPALRLRAQPSLRQLETRWLAPGETTPLLADLPMPMHWLLWRDGDGDVHWRVLDADEADALRCVRAGVDFAGLCERLSLHHGGDGALRAASLLKRWLADGVLAAPNPIT